MDYFLKHQDYEYGRCDGFVHELKPRDTLYKISRFYQVKVDELLEKNPNVDVYNLQVGDKLCIPVNNMPYIIKEGDTLDWLLEHFKLDYKTFRDINPHMTPLKLIENEVVYIPKKQP